MARIRVGILGAGGRGIQSFGSLFTKVYGDQVELAAVADPNRTRAEAGLAFLGVKADVHEDYHDMLGRKDIDAVVVTTPDYLHEEHCVAAFRHGKNVLVDKPLAITGKGCLRVIEEAKRADKLLYMGFNLRHDVVLSRLKALIAAGTFGEVFSLQAIEHYDGGRSYMSRWNRLKKYSGGLWIHKGSHDFDVINWLIGAPRPAKVSCFGSVFTLNEAHLPFQVRRDVKPGPTCHVCQYAHECPDVHARGVAPAGASADRKALERMFSDESACVDGYNKDLCMYMSDKDTHDQGIAIVEYDNGATASHSEYFVTPFTNRHYLIEGTGGHGEADLHGNFIEVRPRWSKDRVMHNIHRDAGGHGGADPKMCAEFIECVQKGRRPAASGIDGAWSVSIGEACEISRAESRLVRISEVLDVGSDLLKA